MLQHGQVIFMEKFTENVHQKLVPDPILILIDCPQLPMHARNLFENKIF